MVACHMVRPFIARYPHMWRDPYHVNFILIILQPPTNEFLEKLSQSTEPSKSSYYRSRWDINQDPSPYLNQNHENSWHIPRKHFTLYHKTNAGFETIKMVHTKIRTRLALGSISEKYRWRVKSQRHSCHQPWHHHLVKVHFNRYQFLLHHIVYIRHVW
jgi:hypothetical protein